MTTTLLTSTSAADEDTMATPRGWRLGRVVRRTVTFPVRTGVALLGVPARVITWGNQAGQWVALAEETVARIVVLVDAVEVLVAEIARTAGHAAGVADLADAVALDSAKVVLSADDLTARAQLLLALYEPVLTGAHPTVAHTAAVARPHHVDAVIELLNLTPELLDLITPALRGMGELSPELGQLADRFEAIGQIVEGLPGASRLRKRGIEHDEQAD